MFNFSECSANVLECSFNVNKPKVAKQSLNENDSCILRVRVTLEHKVKELGTPQIDVRTFQFSSASSVLGHFKARNMPSPTL